MSSEGGSQSGSGVDTRQLTLIEDNLMEENDQYGETSEKAMQ